MHPLPVSRKPLFLNVGGKVQEQQDPPKPAAQPQAEKLKRKEKKKKRNSEGCKMVSVS